MKITRERLRQIIMEEAALGRYAFPKVAVTPDPEKAKEEDTPLEKELAIRINAHFRKNYPLRQQTADQIQALMSDYPGVFRMYTGGDVYRGMHAPAELTKTILVDKWNVLTPLQRGQPTTDDGGVGEGDVVGSSWSKKLETPGCFVDKMRKPENYGFILVASTSENKFIDEAPLTNYKFASYGKPDAVTIDPGEEQPQKPVAVGGNERWAPEGCGANQYEAVGIGPIKMTRAIITKIPNGATKQDVLAVLGGRVPDYIQFTNEVKQQLESAPQQEQPVTENRMRITPERLREIITEEVRQKLLVEQIKKDLLQEGLVDFVKKFFDEDYYENMMNDLEGGEIQKVAPPPQKKKDKKLFFDLPGKRRIIQLALIGLFAGGVAEGLGTYADSYDPAELAAAENIRDAMAAGQENAQNISNFMQMATAEGETPTGDIYQDLDQIRNTYGDRLEAAPISPGFGMMANGKIAKGFAYVPADQIPDDELLPAIGMTKADYELLLRMIWLAGDSAGDERLEQYVTGGGRRGSSVFWSYHDDLYSPVLDVQHSDEATQEKMRELYGEEADQFLLLPLEWSVAYDLLQKRAAR